MNLTMRYSLLAIDGDWRSAAIPAKAHAHAQPLRAIRTDLHLGPLGPSHSYASVTNDAFVVTAFKPAIDSPSVIMRGYEAYGSAGAETLFNASPSMLRVWRSNPIEESLNPFSVATQGFRLELEPFSIATYALDFGVPAGKLGAETVDEAAGPKFTRYWLHNNGAAPEAALAAAVLFDGNLEDDTVTLRVSNPSGN
jgi:hypothetical protein